MQERGKMLYLIQAFIYHKICKLIFYNSVLDLFTYIMDFFYYWIFNQQKILIWKWTKMTIQVLGKEGPNFLFIYR